MVNQSKPRIGRGATVVQEAVQLSDGPSGRSSGIRTYLLVVTPNASVARWAREPYVFGHPLRYFVPLVLGPEELPWVTDPAWAAAQPELALLSAMAYPNSPDIVRAALAGNAGLDPDRALLYTELALRTLEGAARSALGQLMSIGNYEYRTDYVRRLAKQFEEAEARGRAQGEARGKADSLLKILRARRLAVTQDEETRIRATSDLAVLDALARARARGQHRRPVLVLAVVGAQALVAAGVGAQAGTV